MDPGHKYLQNLKTVPNLVNEDPSITTPQNTAFVDRPWSEVNKVIEEQRKKHLASTVSKDALEGVPESPSERTKLGHWDASTGYQDTEHTASSWT